MALKILHKRSITATGGVADAPLPADLDYGEIGINYVDADPTLYIKDSTNIVRPLKLTPTGNNKYSIANDDAGLVGGDATTAINAALVTNGDITNSGDLLVSDQCEITNSGNADVNVNVTIGTYWWDGTVWFLSGGGASVEVGDTAPATPAVGDLWWNSDDGRLYVWYEDVNSSQWVDASPEVTGDFVSKSGDTMTGDLTVPNITVPGTITSPQTPVVMCNFGITLPNTITINSSLNVASVQYVGNLGQYRIIYNTPLTNTGVVSTTATVGLVNGGSSYCNVIAAGPSQTTIGTLSVQTNGSLAAEASTYYNFVVWDI